MPFFVLLTLFPEALEPYLEVGVLGIARRKGLARIELVDFRDFARDRHRTVDDRPFGGGPGMVLKPEPIVECVEWLERRHGRFRRIAMCPSGERFDQRKAEELSRAERVLLLCGRYEGFDERIHEVLGTERISMGDFVLAGGELPALAVTEAAVRLVPGVLGDERSPAEDSFGARGGLDHPHYTRPRVFRGRSVPAELLRGDHASVARLRERLALENTRRRRPDLLEGDPSRGQRNEEEDTDDTSGCGGAKREPAAPRQHPLPPDRSRPGGPQSKERPRPPGG